MSFLLKATISLNPPPWLPNSTEVTVFKNLPEKVIRVLTAPVIGEKPSTIRVPVFIESPLGYT